MSKDYGILGVGPDLQLGKRGPRWIQGFFGVIRARNVDDTAFTRVQAADSTSNDDLVTRRQLLSATAGVWQSANVTQVIPGLGTFDLVTLGTLNTNGGNLKVNVTVTGVDTASVGDQNQRTYIQSFHRSNLGVITGFSPDLDPGKRISTIAGFSIDIDYSLVILPTNSIVLRATNSGLGAYAGQWVVQYFVQLGGIGT